MILRRLATALREQNWFTVALEILIVVVGIYIGLQADAWMSSKSDRVLEREYLERLVADLNVSIADQENNIRDTDKGIVSIDYVAQLLRSQSFDDADEELVTAGVNAMGWVAAPSTIMVTIRELQSTGNITLIRDVSIRMAIGQFERSYADTQFSASHNMEFMAASAPEVMTWSFMSPIVPGEHHSMTEAEDESLGYILQYDSERMLKNPDAANITSWISGWSKYHGAVLMQHHKDTIEFRDLLNVTLANFK